MFVSALIGNWNSGLLPMAMAYRGEFVLFDVHCAIIRGPQTPETLTGLSLVKQQYGCATYTYLALSIRRESLGIAGRTAWVLPCQLLAGTPSV